MIRVIIVILMKLKFAKLAYFILSIASIIFGKFSTFKLLDRKYWLQKQGGVFFVDFCPNYRLKGSDVKEFCEDVYFNSYTPRSGDVCVDIGAGVGTETQLMSDLVGEKGRVFSIEASPKVYKALELCIEYNKLKNVTACNCAISNENGTVAITDNIENYIANAIVKDAVDGCDMVTSMTIDKYISNNGIELIDYMKINIEGAEILLIQAFKKIKNVKHIAISSHDFLANKTGNKSLFTTEAVVEFLKANNFEIYIRFTNVDYKDGWIYGKNKAFQD
jgi:FkbM family methyltransferase